MVDFAEIYGMLSGWLSAVPGLLDTWQWEAFLRLALCALIGGIVGMEREYHGRPAGLRTHGLVCMGCCLVMLTSIHFQRLYADFGVDSVVRLDPARLAYGVVAGIGFLGAGVIMKSGLSVHGLTTAASLWCMAAIGLSIGVGMYAVAGFGAICALLILTIMHSIDRLIGGHQYVKLSVTQSGRGEIPEMQNAIIGIGGKILGTQVEIDCTQEMTTAIYTIRFSSKREPADMNRVVLSMIADRFPNISGVHVE
ncbi:MAG: MgtC/SapB family protein [Deltaproteobacteria bacterium]|nr:MgtC/SapB family protein [Deltaproteobacteria bacterium]